MYHLTLLYPTRALLADALRRLLAAGVEQAMYTRPLDLRGQGRAGMRWRAWSSSPSTARSGSVKGMTVARSTTP